MPWTQPRGVRRPAARDREHPRHPARHQGADGPAPALAAGRRRRGHGAARRRPPRARGVVLAIHTHVNHAQSVTPLVAEAARAMLDAGVRDVRNQGVLHARRQRLDRTQLLDLCFALLDGAGIMPYYFYMCDMIPHAEHWRVVGRAGAAAAARHHGLPARLRDAADRLRRAVRRQALGAPARRRTTASAASRTGRRTTAPSIEAADAEALTRTLRVLRPDRHAARRGPGVVGRARRRRRSGRPRGHPHPRLTQAQPRKPVPRVHDTRVSRTQRTGLRRRQAVGRPSKGRQHDRRPGRHVGRRPDPGQQVLEPGRAGDPDLEDVGLVARDRVAGLDLRDRRPAGRARRRARPGRAA